MLRVLTPLYHPPTYMTRVGIPRRTGVEREIISRHLQGMCQAQAELLGEGKPASCNRPMTHVYLSLGPAWDRVWDNIPHTTRLLLGSDTLLPGEPQRGELYAPQSETRAPQRLSAPQQTASLCCPFQLCATATRISRRRLYAFHPLGVFSRPSVAAPTSVTAGQGH